jgi:glycosyltransferase involved in cell wall biosynthesis
MRALVTLEDHLWRGPDGYAYVHGPAGYSVWSELLESFDEVVLVARVGRNNAHSAEENQIEGPSVTVRELPDYRGPWQYLLKLRELRQRMREAVRECDCYILHAPGLVAELAWREISRLGRSYALDVVGDPWDALGPGTVRSPFRSIYRRVATRTMKLMCERADATLYCSSHALQKRYPPGRGSYTVVSPRVILSKGYASEQFLAERFHRIAGGQDIRIGFIGSFAQLYKGPDILIHAVSRSLASCPRLMVFLVGEGRYRGTMEALARDLGIQDKIAFLGQLPFGNAIFDFLDSIDLFVMPSRAEAFGRALLEAMARGCPCVGSNVGGIAELLSPDDLVPSGDWDALAKKIMEVAGDPERLKQMSIRNLEKAREFNPDVLREARSEFYRYVRVHSGTRG